MIIDLLVKQKEQVSRNRRSHLFSLSKAVSWRIIGTLDTMVISYLITGKLRFALSIGFVEVFTKIFLFYLHDRAWEHFANRKTDHAG